MRAPLLAMCLLLGCQSNAAEPSTNAPASGAPTPQTSQPAPAMPSKVTWAKPERWEELSTPKRMRLKTYKVPAQEGDGEDAEVVVSRAGGSKSANIRRWEGQFSEAAKTKVEEQRPNGVSVTLVEIDGTFSASSGGPMVARPAGEPKRNWTMLVAMVHTAPQAHFFKLTGPRKTVAAAREEFHALVASIRPAD